MAGPSSASKALEKRQQGKYAETYPFISLHTLAHLLQVIVVVVVDVAKSSDLIARRQPSVSRRAAVHNAVDLGKRWLQHVRDRVGENLGSGARAARRGVRNVCVGKVGKVLVKVLFDDAHQLLVVVPQVDNARSCRSYYESAMSALDTLRLSPTATRRSLETGDRASKRRGCWHTLRHVNISPREAIGREERRVHVDVMLSQLQLLAKHPRV